MVVAEQIGFLDRERPVDVAKEIGRRPQISLPNQVDERSVLLDRAPLPLGHEGALWAQAFDADTRELLGEERLVSDATVMSPGYSSGAYSAAATGRLVYAAGQIESSNRLLSYDKEGNLAETLTFSATRVEDQQFSPDGAQLAVTLNTVEASEEGDIWIRDLARNGPAGLTVLFIPSFNVDGHERFGPYNRVNQNGPREMGWRVTAQNLNLNRDYVKAKFKNRRLLSQGS